MADKYIGKPGIEKKTRYKVGEEIKESAATAHALVLLGLAERVSEEDEKQTQPVRRGRLPKYMTRDMQAEGHAVTPGHAVGAVTTANIRQPASPVLPEPPVVTSPEPEK